MKRQSTASFAGHTTMPLTLAPHFPVNETASSSAFRSHVTRMSSNELRTEFYSLMRSSVGKHWSFGEARDVQFLMETLLSKSHSNAFKAQLQESLRVLNGEIARMLN